MIASTYSLCDSASANNYFLAAKLNRYTVRDAGSKGLFIDVTPGGVKSGIFRYQFNGKQEK